MSGIPADRAAGLWLRLLGEQPASQLERIEQQLAELRRELAELRSPGQTNHAPPAPAPLEEALRALEKQIGRAGREQLKANSIAEAQQNQIAALLDQVRAAEAQRAADAAAQQEQGRGALAAARLEVAQQLLPALDGIDAALRAGQQLLERTPAAVPGPQRPESVFTRLLQAPAASASLPAQAAELRAGLAAWLQGLTFIRQRLLDTLAAEQVRPIDASGRPFDPERHVALGVAPASDSQPAGTVAEELRRGYLAGERILRPAEVIVASDEPG